MTRDTTTCIIRRNGTVSYWSRKHQAWATSPPEGIPYDDLKAMGGADLRRLQNRFGTVKLAGSTWRLAAETEPSDHV